MKKFTLLFVPFLIYQTIGLSKNPIIPNKGANDPHIRIFNDRAYLSASHDRSIDSKSFSMDDWWLWSSDNLVDWKLESVLKPEVTYIGKPFSSCWATDIAMRNGKYFWYFSEGNEQSGVVVGDSPAGPWKDPLGKPLLTSEMTPTHEYDMGIIQDAAGDFYIVFGVWDYYIAKLNKDMISLAEKPRKIEIKNPRGPYNRDGKNLEKPTDDKPFIHSYNGKYYLSWGCFYAMSDNVYGPYNYTGSIIDISSFAPGFEKPTWPNGFLQGRHGSFFEFHNQWYFAYCDISQTGNRYFRDTFISYVHYKANGEMALIRVDGIGVGEYDANSGMIEAEDYFKASGISKKEIPNGGFAITSIENNDHLIFPNIKGLKGKNSIEFKIKAKEPAAIEIRQDTPKGALITTCNINKNKTSGSFEIVKCKLPEVTGTQCLCLVFRGKGKDLFDFDGFRFIAQNNLIYLNEERLEKVKELIAKQDTFCTVAYQKLIAEANKELSKSTNPVTGKTQIPLSGDVHDYLSIAPYWWPNPETADGFPWIRKDGQVNPMTRGYNTDQVRLSEMFDGLNKLAMAYFFSGGIKYAEKARSIIKIWFIDESTKVNPNINFGQGIPGDKNNPGRPAGMIEWNGVSNLITTIQLLSGNGLFSDLEKKALDIWLFEFYNWMKTSEFGVQNDNGNQNHSNWYDFKMVGLARYLGLNEEAKSRVEAAKIKRITQQIEPDGAQPKELGRTKALDYSEMNLRAMISVAEMGMPLGVDLWGFTTSDGRSLRKAFEFLKPYALGDKKWTYQQITPGGAEKEIEDRLKPLFSIAGTIFGEELIDPRVNVAKNLSYMQRLQYPPLSMIK